MRPYQLYPRGPWLDLDHVLEIEPPEFVDRMGYGGYFVELRLYLAFRDDPRVFGFQSESEFVREDDYSYPKLDEHGFPDKLWWLLKSVYLPLLKEWGNIVALIHKDPAHYGYNKERYERLRR